MDAARCPSRTTHWRETGGCSPTSPALPARDGPASDPRPPGQRRHPEETTTPACASGATSRTLRATGGDRGVAPPAMLLPANDRVIHNCLDRSRRHPCSGILDYAHRRRPQLPGLGRQRSALRIPNAYELVVPPRITQLGVGADHLCVASAGARQMADEPKWQPLDAPPRPCGGQPRSELRRHGFRRPILKSA
ncbi:hypothetical protein XF35_25235 [Streptomyces platensis subsp. clarensis]|nr:hypothetical protein [Streptomyces platensis subsp. clarensis]